MSFLLVLSALALAVAAAVELLGREGESAERRRRGLSLDGPLAAIAERLSLERRLARAGLQGRVEVPVLLAAKAAGAFAGLAVALPAAPTAPGRLSMLVAIGLPAAGFMAPEAMLERRARRRLRALRGSLPDALDLVATAASAGRSPVTGLAEIAGGDGELARELSVLVAETSCGAPQREAFAALRRRVPSAEIAAMCGLIERSRRFGSPLSEQLHAQASSLRGSQRRRITEQAARAAPKIQLAVALLLVPSVLLMIAAGLLANVDRFLAGI